MKTIYEIETAIRKVLNGAGFKFVSVYVWTNTNVTVCFSEKEDAEAIFDILDKEYGFNEMETAKVTSGGWSIKCKEPTRNL